MQQLLAEIAWLLGSLAWGLGCGAFAGAFLYRDWSLWRCLALGITVNQVGYWLFRWLFRG